MATDMTNDGSDNSNTQATDGLNDGQAPRDTGALAQLNALGALIRELSPALVVDPFDEATTYERISVRTLDERIEAITDNEYLSEKLAAACVGPLRLPVPRGRTIDAPITGLELAEALPAILADYNEVMQGTLEGAVNIASPAGIEALRRRFLPSDETTLSILLAAVTGNPNGPALYDAYLNTSFS